MTYDEYIKEFCQDMAKALGQDPEKEWEQHRKLAEDHFINEAYMRVRKKWWAKSTELVPTS